MTVDGRRLDDIVAQAGGTPLFVYSRAAIRSQIGLVRQLLPERAQLVYAMKANPMPELLRFLRSQVDGVDVASAGELDLALNGAGFEPERISFAGPGKTDAEIDACIRSGAVLVAESLAQLRVAREVLRRAGTPVRGRVAFRINPAIELRGAGMRMGGGPSPFGVDVEELPRALDEADRLGIPIEGLHCHFGSQILDGEIVAEAMRGCFAQMHPHLDRLRRPAWLNVGGGFGVPIAPGDRHLDLAPIRVALREIGEAIAAEGGGLRLRIELGRYLVAEGGVYVMRVLERKTSRGKTFVICDGGLHHMQSATGNFGQVIRRNWPVVPATPIREAADATGRVDIVGPLCTPLDCVGRDVADTGFEVGTLACILRAGAYGRSASPSDFLGHPPAIEILV
ncbi:MAG: alanine racemase [Burkholderiaceae bacterium]|nr:alanine racemase [Burkholderiaceae bacterium]